MKWQTSQRRNQSVFPTAEETGEMVGQREIRGVCIACKTRQMIWNEDAVEQWMGWAGQGRKERTK